MWYSVAMQNKEIAEQILKGKKKFVRVGDLKRATAIRVAGHRLGGVITVQREDKSSFRLVKSAAKVTHRPKAKQKKLRSRGK